MSERTTKEQLITIAKLYYMGNMSQEEIAVIMNLSRPKVSRMLKAAREQQIVKFSIVSSDSDYNKLADQIKDRFALGNVIIVPSEVTEDLTKLNLGKAGAKYLTEKLDSKSALGLAWGSSIASILKFLPNMSYAQSSVWQLTACLPSYFIDLDGHEIAKRFAKKLGGSYHLINAPFIVNSSLLRKLLLNEPEIKAHFEALKNLDIALVGLGSSDPTKSMTYKGKYISLQESKDLVENGCAADICGHRLHKDATPAETFISDRVISISLDTLKTIPEVIGIGAGKDKVDSIVAASKGGFITTLITDEIAAISLLEA